MNVINYLQKPLNVFSYDTMIFKRGICVMIQHVVHYQSHGMLSSLRILLFILTNTHKSLLCISWINFLLMMLLAVDTFPLVLCRPCPLPHQVLLMTLILFFYNDTTLANTNSLPHLHNASLNFNNQLPSPTRQNNIDPIRRSSRHAPLQNDDMGTQQVNVVDLMPY